MIGWNEPIKIPGQVVRAIKKNEVQAQNMYPGIGVNFSPMLPFNDDFIKNRIFNAAL